MFYLSGMSLNIYSVVDFSCTLNRYDRKGCRCGCGCVTLVGVMVLTLPPASLTPPQYVRTISLTALFKGGEQGADRKRGKGDKKSKRENQVAFTSAYFNKVTEL